MTEPSTLVGRDELIAEVVREINKGKHVVLTGAVGIGKSAALQAALKVIEPRPSEWYQFDPVAYDAGEHPESLEVEHRPPKGLCPPTGGRIPSATGPCSTPRTGQHPETVEVEHRPPKGLCPPTGGRIPARGDPCSAPRTGQHPEALDLEQRPQKVLCPPTGGRIPARGDPCSAPRTGQHPESLEVEHRPPKGLSPPAGQAPLASSPQRLAGRTPPPPDSRATPKELDRKDRVLVYLSDHQAKGQFVQMARRLLETGILRPSELDLAKRYDALPPRDIPWTEIRRHINRLSIRDLSAAIIPAIYNYPGQVLIAVDDMTSLTPTQQAFWLAVFEHAQVVTCASARKTGLRKLWWKMKVIEVPALAPDASKTLVRDTIARQGMLIESPELYVGHVVKQAGGNPQAIIDMMDESSKERVVDKRRIREMKHQAGIRYADFTPVMLIAGALVVGTRYLAIGLGDTALYVLAGLGAALFLSLRFFMARGTGRATA